MPSYSREFVQMMRAALDEVMSKVPADQATSAVKARVAEAYFERGCGGADKLSRLDNRSVTPDSRNNFQTDLSGEVARRS
jgi:hypothetical protein